MPDQNVAVTGASGFLGWHVATRLRDQGWCVTAVVRAGTRNPVPDGVQIEESPLDSNALARAIDGAAVVIHAAGVTRAARDATFAAVNTQGTAAVVEAANRAGARMLLVSSQAAAGAGTPQRPARESDPPHPLTAYGRSKLAAEHVVRTTAAHHWLIVRPPAIYGPRDRQFLPLFRLASRGWFPLAAPPSTAFTLMHVDDAAEAIARAAEQLAAGGEPRGQGVDGATMFLGHRVARTTEQLLRALAAAYRRPYRPNRVPPWLLRAAAWTGDLERAIGRVPLLDRARLTELQAPGFVCAVDVSAKLLGVTAAIDLDEGVRRTAAWYRAAGWT
jgi:nucleoside-diphosphate-sugar epimerase